MIFLGFSVMSRSAAGHQLGPQWRQQSRSRVPVGSMDMAMFYISSWRFDIFPKLKESFSVDSRESSHGMGVKIAHLDPHP